MPKLKKKTILIFILIVIALYVIVEVIPPLTGALASTEVLEYGKLKVSSTEDCWIVRDETVYKADRTSGIKVFAGEGTLIKKGSTVMQYTSSKKESEDSNESGDEGSSAYKEFRDRLGDDMVAEKDGKSDRKGLFSFYIDGYESYLTPDRINKFKEDEMLNIGSVPEKVERSSAAKGDPIFKIADNSIWYLVCWIDEGEIARFEKDKQVKVKLEDSTIEAKVDRIKQAGDKWFLVLSTNRYYKDFLKLRRLEAEIISTDMKGLLISNDCLIMKGKKAGCYVKTPAGDYVFKEVQTLATDGDKTLVTETEFFDDKGKPVSTVKAYDEVKRDPN